VDELDDDEDDECDDDEDDELWLDDDELDELEMLQLLDDDCSKGMLLSNVAIIDDHDDHHDWGSNQDHNNNKYRSPQEKRQRCRRLIL
jgi:hypothetical protein